MGSDHQQDQTQIKAADRLLKPLDSLLNWARSRSLWPMFFGLSCCFVEEATAITARYDIARFGAEVFRPSPRQADLLIISGTVFKKIAPVVRRLYDQMPEPKWVISMGSCANTGGMYDTYSVVQGVNQILPVDVYIPGCPPRPEAVLHGLTLLQEKITAKERPARPVLHLAGGTQGTRTAILTDGQTKSRDPRGPGMDAIPIRGNDATPPGFKASRSDRMWRPAAHHKTLSATETAVLEDLRRKFGDQIRIHESVADMPTLTTTAEQVKSVLTYLKDQGASHFRRLEDLTAIDESARRQGDAGKGSAEDRDFTLVYHLTSLADACRVRVEVPLSGTQPEVQSVTDIWPSANWYEREVYDMFGLRFDGHPRLRRILMPDHWQGHPLRKNYPGRATEMPAYTLEDARNLQPVDAGIFMNRQSGEDEMILNIGPHHVSTHGLMRYTVVLDGEEIRDLDMEIGYHHRAAEKVGERQTWHQFIPYTDRVDYLSGAANNLPYVMSVETLAGIRVPDRAQYIRILLSELFRLSNHLVFVGTFAHDIGAITPTFYTFREREMVLDIVETITGGRLHPSWFRLGGVAADLPDGWRPMVEDLLKALLKSIDEYEALITKNPIIRSRTMGIGRLTADQAVEWGITGPNLRACGVDWDLRKTMPYSGYDSIEFEVPTTSEGDSYARYLVRVQEMRESIRIIDQVTRKMPPGRYVSEDYRFVVPARQDMKKDIESLIHHFVNVTRGPSVPKGEAYMACEVPRGEQGYYVVSDGVGYAYRMRIRAPGFANVQTMPLMAKGWTISDLIAIIGSVDYILPDIDR